MAIWLSDEDFEDDWVETGLCPRCGAELDSDSLGLDGAPEHGTLYSCRKCGWSEVVPPCPI